jgi:uncharacterized membrane protein
MRKKAIDILVIVGLVVVIVLLTVRTVYKPPPYKPAPSWWAPSFDSTDYAILIGASMVAGIVLIEPEPIIFGWIGSIFLSFSISIIYTSLYSWFVLGWGKLLSNSPYGFENLVFAALSSIFRITFLGYLLVFLGLFLGGFAGYLTGIDKKIDAAFM